MSATSPNGWPVSADPDAIDIIPFEVAGVTFYGGVRSGRCHDVLKYVAAAVHSRVQPVNQAFGCYGWNYRANANDPSVWSNHASGTAIDFNATQNPNGVPTSAVWTPAQIAEVHKILDEVDNVVRWGGDYSGTPDSMHFEINVSPTALEGSSFDFPAAATRWPIGLPNDQLQYGNWNLLPVLTEMSVSYPTLAAWDSQGMAYWQYTATETGRVSIDALLSHYISPEFWTSAGPSVDLQVYKVLPNGNLQNIGGSSYFPGGFGYPERNQGRLLVTVQAGQQFVIRTQAATEWPYIRTVVRIGAVQTEPDWVQPPDQVRAWARSDGQWAALSGRKDQITKLTTRFEGNDFDIYRAFGGPEPSTVPDAIVCAWRWARRGWQNFGVVYWSGDGGVEWDGGGVCRPLSIGGKNLNSGQNISSFSRHLMTAGYFYHAEPGLPVLTSGMIEWHAFAGTQVLVPQEIVTQETRSGVGTTTRSLIPYLPPPGPNEIFEWESTECTLVDLDYSIDHHPGANDNHTETVVSTLYLSDYDPAVEDLGVEDAPDGAWGPFNWFIWMGQSWSDTPENWAAGQHALASYSGTPTSWAELLDTYWKNFDGTLKPGVRFTIIPNNMLVDAIPLPSAGGSDDEYIESYYYCYVAIRSTVRPSRYRIWPDPGIPDIDWAGVGAILIAQTDAGQVLH